VTRECKRLIDDVIDGKAILLETRSRRVPKPEAVDAMILAIAQPVQHER